jgi:hypothetical protein
VHGFITNVFFLSEKVVQKHYLIDIFLGSFFPNGATLAKRNARLAKATKVKGI